MRLGDIAGPSLILKRLFLPCVWTGKGHNWVHVSITKVALDLNIPSRRQLVDLDYVRCTKCGNFDKFTFEFRTKYTIYTLKV